MNTRQVRKVCALDEQSSGIFKASYNFFGAIGTSYDRILKVSRTIADLDKSERIQSHHVAEAIQYRSLDRDGWLGNESG